MKAELHSWQMMDLCLHLSWEFSVVHFTRKRDDNRFRTNEQTKQWIKSHGSAFISWNNDNYYYLFIRKLFTQLNKQKHPVDRRRYAIQYAMRLRYRNLMNSIYSDYVTHESLKLHPFRKPQNVLAIFCMHLKCSNANSPLNIYVSQFKISILFRSDCDYFLSDCKYRLFNYNWFELNTIHSFIVHTINYSPWTKSYQLQSFLFICSLYSSWICTIFIHNMYTVFLLYSQFKCPHK